MIHVTEKLVIGVVYNSILVIIDRLTKFAYMLLYKKSNTAKELAYIFIRIVVISYRTPNKIISN